MKTTTIAKYYVVDCEHEGDIRRACNEVVELGGTVITTEWDGHDCGEAWVYAEMPTDTFNELRKQEMEWYDCEYLRDYFKRKKLI